MRVIDLSKPVQFNRDDPGFMQVKIKHKPHRASKILVWLLGLPSRLFPRDFTGWADDTITKMGVHATTHIDAPWHYGPVSAGEPAETIEKIPLDRCIGPGVVFDMTHKQDNDPITAADMEEALAKTGATLTPQTIVLIRTGRDRYQGTKEFWKRGTGMSVEATEWLLDRGILVMGIDQWGWDLPFHAQIAKAKATNDDTLFWEAHRVGQRRPYWHMEQLVNLGALPAHGFEVAVFPLKLVGASAAPARVVALIREPSPEAAGKTSA
ncbi:MAG: cyclase family protein [Methyloligella sp. ZOD6]